jgi:hypothetical protein
MTAAAVETFDPAATMGLPRAELAMRGQIKLGGFQLRRHR